MDPSKKNQDDLEASIADLARCPQLLQDHSTKVLPRLFTVSIHVFLCFLILIVAPCVLISSFVVIEHSLRLLIPWEVEFAVVLVVAAMGSTYILLLPLKPLIKICISALYFILMALFLPILGLLILGFGFGRWI